MIIEGIILAAGFSSRAGTYKLTLELNGKTIIERCIEGMYDACSKIIVVGGYNIEKLTPILNKYSKIKLAYNENYQTGMLSSVIKGFRHTDGDKVFMIPGDYPLISLDVYESLLKVNANIVIPTYEGIKGHPVLMSKAMTGLLLHATGISNLREFISRHGFTTLEVDCPSILMDIDTPEDYVHTLNYFNKVKYDSHNNRQYKQRKDYKASIII